MTSDYAHHFRLVRALVPLLILVGAGMFFWLFAQKSDIVSTEVVQGVVVEVNTGETRSFRTGNQVSMTTARIELPSGEYTRVLVARQQLSVGDPVTLTETRYADGQVRYRVPH